MKQEDAYAYDPEGGLYPAENRPTEQQAALIGTVVQNMMAPILESIGKMLQNNTEAMNQIAAAQQITSDRLEALEKQVRLNTPVTGTQVKYLNDAARKKARELLEEEYPGYGNDRKGLNRLSGMIRKQVLSRYGIGTLRELPKFEYTVAMKQIELYDDPLAVMDVADGIQERLGVPK